MKARLIAVGFVLFGIVACAPQGKKLTIAPVAEGPGGSAPQTSAAKTVTLTETSVQGEQTADVYKDGTITVILGAAQQDGYSWRLAEIPDPTVLKLASQSYAPPATGQGRGQETWIFQAVGDGDVEVKMWYGNARTAPVIGNANFKFVASVSDEPKPEKKPAKHVKKS